MLKARSQAMASSAAATTKQTSATADRARAHHIDRRAHQLAQLQQGDDDDLLTTRQVADWLGVSDSVSGNWKKQALPLRTTLCARRPKSHSLSPQ